MRYLLSDYDQERFNTIDDLVRLCYFDLSVAFKTPVFTLGQISTTKQWLTLDDKEYIESFGNILNGVCFHGPKSFKVWLSPTLKPGDLLFELTLIHELCHGYIGPIMHSRQWRRFFGRAVILYGELLNPSFAETQPEWQVKHTIRRYRGEEKPEESYGDLVLASDDELEIVVDDMNRHMKRLLQDWDKLQEMRKVCQKSSSNTTPTPAYLASLQKDLGTGYRLK